MEQSILNSTKKILGLEEDYIPFDLDIMTHINASFAALQQIGVGPIDGFMITDDVTVWGDYPVSSNQLQMVKAYVYLRVRLLFDPPATSFHLTAAEEQLREFEWRLNLAREYALSPEEVNRERRIS